MVIREEILGGLKTALARGEPLKKAMMSFYNSGYAKKDIEEAARALYSPQFPQPIVQPQVQLRPPPQKTPPTTQPPPIQPVRPVRPVRYLQPRIIQQPVRTVQRVSGYGVKPKSLTTIITFVLIFFLLFLLGVLAALFFFRDELAGFFNNLL